MNQLIESSMLAAFLIFAWSRPTRKAWLLSAVAAMALGCYCGPPFTRYCGIPGGILPKLVHLFCYWGLGAILSGPFVPLFERHIPLSSSLSRLRDMLVPPLFVVFSALFLNAAILLRPVTYDRFLYAFDGSLGFQPGFWAARVLMHNYWLGVVCNAAYFQLPLALTLAYLVEKKRSRDSARRALWLFLLIGIVGFACYQVLPAVGSAAAMPGVFPTAEPRLQPADIQPVDAFTGVRNCIPSLHTSWMVALWWIAAPRRRWLRIVVAALLGCALLWTLAFHYLIDMVVALPFTVALFALTQRDRIRSDRIRGETILWSASLFFGWLLLLRFCVTVFLISPWLSWAAIASTVALSVGLHLRAVSEAQTTRLHSKNPHSSTPLRSTRNAERTTHPTRCFIESARPMKAGNTTRT
jgi:hypothetical protein